MYLNWQEKTISDFSEKNITDLYNQGFVFTRKDHGVMNQTRSVRVKLENFELTSENKRILNRTEEIKLEVYPLPYEKYDWSIAKMGKDFYGQKFGEKTFSANKLKEILTNAEKSNFNRLLVYTKNNEPLGYSVAYENSDIIHYSYPFYNLNFPDKNIGMGMMTKAITYTKEQGKKYFYLGSAQRPTDTYKFQFKGLEWFDGTNWREDLNELKEILKKL